MIEESKNRNRGETRNPTVRVLGTNPENPEEGRIFVWTKTGWFERIEGQLGDVAFTPVADSENELREYISRDDLSFELVPLARKHRIMVSEEFLEQAPSYSDSPEYASGEREELEEPEESSEDNDQKYHQHGL
jgi:hypothetical protein